MKNTNILALLSLMVIVILSSCSIFEDSDDSSDTFPDEAILLANLDIIIEGWNERNPSVFEQHIADNFVRTSYGAPHFVGRDGFEELMRNFSSSFPDQEVVLTSRTVKDNQVFTRWTVSGTHMGEFLGAPATGISVDIHGYSVWTFDNNTILTHEDAYWDDLGTLIKLGFSVEPPGE